MAIGRIRFTKIVQSSLDTDSPFDVVLMDMQMPLMDGYHAAKALREMGFRNPIITLTADAMQGDMARCLPSGCDTYLSKPIDADELLRVIALYTDSGSKVA
ncbi:MAG TPA: response regulator [Planctomycetaceae bacterium]|nr:response regulator [Planctomycetaceae bacterium]HQZ68890.1 response regulator [Planctomycetaceae bacterium]